jgi:hypothetical protein
MKRTTGLIALLPILLLSACSMLRPAAKPAPVVAAAPVPVKEQPTALTPRIAASADMLSKMAALQERLYLTGAPLLIANPDLCKNQARNLLGFTAKNRHSYPSEYNEAAHIAFGMGERLQVSGVLAGSGAARAGLRRGDVLLSAEGKPLPVGDNAESTAGTVFGPLVGTHATIKLSIERDGAHMVVPVPVTRACGFRIELGNAENVNSYADGSRVLITRGMMHFAQTDEDLAFVMAKGMAHNILGHAAAMRQTSTLAGMIDNLVLIRPDTSLLIGASGIKPTPYEMDVQADILGLYLVARAGYNVEGASRFWQRLAMTFPETVLNGYTNNHRATAFRVAAIEKTVTDIKLKQASKKPLTP